MRAPKLRRLREVRNKDVDRFVFDRADVLFHVSYAQRSAMVLMLGSTGGIGDPIGVRDSNAVVIPVICRSVHKCKCISSCLACCHTDPNHVVPP